MQDKKIVIFLALILILISGCAQESILTENVTTPVKEIAYLCTANEECDWISTNCCGANAGAFWKCANKDKTRIECPEGMYDCAQVISPKPSEPCGCVDGECKVVEPKQETPKTCDLKCDQYRAPNCPEGCVERCVPSSCSGDVCTGDCEGPGSCACPD